MVGQGNSSWDATMQQTHAHMEWWIILRVSLLVLGAGYLQYQLNVPSGNAGIVRW